MEGRRPTSTTATSSAGVEYEDMFKEITRKLYGEETGIHGPVACPVPVVANGNGGHLSLPEGADRSFTTLISDRVVVGPMDFDPQKEQLFGLAALNGFAQTPPLHMKSPNVNTSRWDQAAATDEDGDMSWNASQLATPSKPGPKPSKSRSTGSATTTKRYSCANCSYSTDRRDLYTRHQHIHETVKPFLCYVCVKQFNRADHVKKHFLRMHRELQYDINKTRRSANATEFADIAPAGCPPPPAARQQTNPEPRTYDGNTRDPRQVVVNLMPIPGHSSSNNTEHGINLVHHSGPVKTEALPTFSTPVKKKGDKSFACCYCPWTGADNWGLKRHLNTHLKPFVCSLCSYKAARPERLVTHVKKVHNKMGCNKCSFVADDHIQLMTHQNGTHQAYNNNVDPTSLNWRPATSAPTQKRGAERLFQYLEADSDPEDHQKQMKMSALSRSGRNTVAMDFHNAGGGAKSTCNEGKSARTTTAPEDLVKSLFSNKGHKLSFIQSVQEFVQRLITGSPDSIFASTTTPPPAKRRRLNSQDCDKENQAQTPRPKTSGTDRGQVNAQMRLIFQMMAQYYDQLIDCETAPELPKAESLKELERILQNNQELTISIKGPASSGDSGLDDEEELSEFPRSKRKSFVPRRIAEDRPMNRNLATWNAIRNKHLSRLMSRRLMCQICVQGQSSLNTAHHSPSSLIMHKRWRHHWIGHCTHCSASFRQRYQLKLHLKLNHNE